MKIPKTEPAIRKALQKRLDILEGFTETRRSLCDVEAEAEELSRALELVAIRRGVFL